MGFPKLSEAIRLGSMLRGQSNSGWADLGPNGELRSCALIAAAEAVGLIVESNGGYMPSETCRYQNSAGEIDPRTGKRTGPTAFKFKYPEEWKDVRERMVTETPCGCSIHRVIPVGAVIVHLHDKHHWTRELIADWVQIIEMTMPKKARMRRPKCPAEPLGAGRSPSQASP